MQWGADAMCRLRCNTRHYDNTISYNARNIPGHKIVWIVVIKLHHYNPERVNEKYYDVKSQIMHILAAHHGIHFQVHAGRTRIWRR